jgi:hypothetical protein
MIRRLLIVVALATATPAAAFAQDLRPAVDRLTRAWGRMDAAALASFASAQGVSLEIGGSRVGPLQPRQVAAALRDLFDDCETISAKAGMAKPVGGSPGTAFFEIAWTTRSRGTTEPQKSTVFLALVVEGDRWRVTEIRHIR